VVKRKISKKIKATLIKSRRDIKKNFQNFFDWIKGAELIELQKCET